MKTFTLHQHRYFKILTGLLLFSFYTLSLNAQIKTARAGYLQTITPPTGDVLEVVKRNEDKTYNFSLTQNSIIRIQFEGAKLTGNPTVQVKVNGVELLEQGLSLPSYSTIQTASLYLNSGNHTITFRGTQTAGQSNVKNIRVQRLRDWSSTSTWNPTGIPSSTSEVVIPEGAVVGIRSFNGKVKDITTTGQIVCAQNGNVQFETEHINVMSKTGLFQAGKKGAPFTGTLKVTLVGNNTGQNSGVGSKYFASGMEATIELHGEEKISWSQLGANAAKGTKNIVMKEAVNWNVGNEILITSSRLNHNEAEKMKIAAISNDGKSITLEKNLRYPHLGVTKSYTRPSDGKTWIADMRAEVGLLSKNIIIQGDAGSDASKFGGHMMVHMNGKAFVDGIELYRMGQTGILGRYPFHWHLIQDGGKGQYFSNNSVHRSFNRAITIHGTESTLVENNFCYDHIGHGIFLEDGSERFNIIRGNVVLLTKRPAKGDEITPSDNQLSEPQNRTPSSYWITNPNNIFENNVAAGTQGTGFWFAMPQRPMGPSANIDRFKNLQPHKEVLGKFSGNVAHSCANGFDIFDQLDANHKIVKNRGWLRTNKRYIDKQTFYSCNLALYGGIGEGRQYTSSVVFRDNIFVDNEVALMHANYADHLECVFVGHSGENLFTNKRYILKAYDGACSITDSYLVGWNMPSASFAVNIGGSNKHPNYVMSGIEMDTPGAPTFRLSNHNKLPKGELAANSPEHVRRWTFALWDKDGSLTKQPAGGTVISNHNFLRDGKERPFKDSQNAYFSPHRYGYLVTPGLIRQTVNHPRMTFTRRKEGTSLAGFFYGHGFYANPMAPVIMSEGFEYSIQLETLPANRQLPLSLQDTYKAGDRVLIRMVGMGSLPGIRTSSSFPSVNSLAALKTVSETSTYKSGNDFYIMLFGIPERKVNFRLLWNSNISWPELDTDGDGITDLQESIAGTDPIGLGPVVENPPLVDKEFKTVWEFNNSGDAEGWNKAKSLVGDVGGNAQNLTVTGVDPQFISVPDLRISSSEYGYLRFRIKSSKAGSVQIFWGNDASKGFSGDRNKVFSIEASGSQYLEYVVKMSDASGWVSNIYRLRLDPDVGNGNDVSIDRISFEKNNLLDCNRKWSGLADIDNCNVCTGGSTGIVPNSTCRDCNGVVNGSATIDDCNVCSGGNTGIVPNTSCIDCNGTTNGTASIDACGVCSGGTTGISPSSPRTWYADTDSDGKGDANNTVQDCNKPSGYVAVAGDQCPNDGNKTTPGECGCGVAEGSCANQNPIASITSPNDGQEFTVGTTIIFGANASDFDGSIFKVNFKINGNYFSQDRTSPYTGSFTPTEAGTYTIAARAFDNDGASVEPYITISVVNTPQNDCAGVVGGSASVDACGVCSGGTTGIAPSTPKTWYVDVDGDGRGDASSSVEDCSKPTGYVAVAGDQCPNDGNKLDPGECGCGVTEGTCNNNNAPTLNFTQPVNGDEFDKGVTLVGNVIASDADGSISNVVLYVNGSLVRQENFAPYDWNHKGQDAALQNMAAGTYVLRAVATDNEGLSSEKSITITVKEEEVVTNEAIIGDECAVKNGVANFEVNSDLRKNATSYSWWFAGSSSSVISPNAAPHAAEITMSQYYDGGEVCVGINSNAAPYYKSYCKSVGVCSAGEELEMAEIEVTEYPNPLEGDQLTIDISEEAGAVEQLVILDEAGLIHYETTSFTSGDKIKIGHLPKGSYIIRIVTENGVMNKKLMKL